MQWDFEPLVHSMFEFYTNAGDVQMCVAVALVLGARVKIDPVLFQKWVHSYMGTVSHHQAHPDAHAHMHTLAHERAHNTCKAHAATSHTFMQICLVDCSCGACRTR